MNEFLKMDIFFVVSTIAVVVVSVLVAYALIRILRILRSVEQISETVSDEAVLVRADVAQLRHNVRQEGFKLKHMSRFAQAAAKRFMGSKSK